MDFNSGPDFDFGQISNTPMQQHMQNGIQRNGSPASFQQPTYQTSSVVPSKRPHADTLTNSPRQASRSLTPQQNHFPQSYPQPANGQPQTNGFQNFGQVHSTTASPSPVMPNQPFNVNGGPQQRVATASPSPFSPAATNAGLQMSPAPSDFSNHAETSQNGISNFGQQNPYMNGHGVGSPQFTSPNNPMMQAGGQMAQHMNSQMNPQMNPQMNQHAVPGSTNMTQEETARRMQMMRNAAMARQQAGVVGPGGMTGVPGMPGMGGMQQGPGGPRPGMQGQQLMPLPPQLQQQQQQQLAQLSNMLVHPVQPREQFLPAIHHFNQTRGMPFNSQLVVAGKPMHPVNLWILVMQAGGFQQVSARKLWPQIAIKLQLITPQTDPQLAQQALSTLAEYWRNNLAPFEKHKLMETQQKRAAIIQRNQQAAANGQARQMQPGMPNPQGPQNPALMHMRRTSGMEAGPPQMSPQQFPSQAGFQPVQPQRPGTQGSMTMSVPSPAPARTPSQQAAKRGMSGSISMPAQSVMPAKQELLPFFTPKDPFTPEPFTFFVPLKGQPPTLEHHGPVALKDNVVVTAACRNAIWRDGKPWYLYNHPDPEIAARVAPVGRNVAMVDVHSVKMAIKSGIAGEVRVALDTLAEVSLGIEDVEMRIPLPLSECDDLLLTLVEFAEDQLDILDSGAEKLPGDPHFTPYEEMIRMVEDEGMEILDVHEPGTLEYDLDLAADRFLCAIQILQNLSSSDDSMRYGSSNVQGHPSGGYARIWESNVLQLSESYVIEMFTKSLQLLSSKEKLLRTHRNSMDFLKDTVMFFSNIALDLDLTSKEDAHVILRFLNLFGPAPEFDSENSLEVMFSSQEPVRHRYLRFAVDTLAKLLARDEPNRGYFRAVFAAEDARHHLLTSTFGLAIAPVPDIDVSDFKPAAMQFHPQQLPPTLPAEIQSILSIVQWRMVYLKQGLLAADILVELMPQGIASLAQAWLSSSDQWAQRIIALVRVLGFGQISQILDRMFDQKIYPLMVDRGLSVLQSLAERARDDEGDSRGPVAIVNKQSYLTASQLLRSAYEAWGEPTHGPPQDRLRVRRLLRQIEALIEIQD